MEGAPVWRQPVVGSYPPLGVLGLAGRDRLTRWMRLGGPLPPLTHLTGARPTAIGGGTADAEMPASGWLVNSAGLIGGGTLAMLADIVFGCSVESQLPAATPYTTAELSLTFLRPARPGATLTAHGQAIHVARRVGLSEAFLIDPRDERLLAHGTSRLAVLPPLDGLPEIPDDEPTRAATTDPDPWERPAPREGVVDPGLWEQLSGREVLERQVAGDLPQPPIHELTGLTLAEVGDGEATMSLPATEWLNSPVGRMQGGAIAMLADTAMLSAAVTTAGAGTAVAGLDLKVNYLRPVYADGGELRARASLLHSGRTLAVCRARVENPEGKPVALATGTAMYLPRTPATLGPEVELSSPDDEPIEADE